VARSDVGFSFPSLALPNNKVAPLLEPKKLARNTPLR